MKSFDFRNVHKALVTGVGLVFLVGCGQDGTPDDATSSDPALVRVQTAAQVLEGAHLPGLHPAPLNGSEILKVAGDRRLCTFNYTRSGGPVVAIGLGQAGAPEIAVVKLNGSLVSLEPDLTIVGLRPGAFVLTAAPIRLSVVAEPRNAVAAQAPERQVDAEMVFEVDPERSIGYAGYPSCSMARPARAAVR